MYSQVLVCYDIENDKKRRKLYEELKDLGLRPVQKSVFWGYLLQSEKRVVKYLLKKYCDKSTDRGFMVNANLDKNLEYSVGYSKDEFKKPDSFDII